ncbi:MAG: hypothetical protein JNM85_02050 [Chthonomonas sp.]|nr:hypothetical protein [Chthonomonas sp.]
MTTPRSAIAFAVLALLLPNAGDESYNLIRRAKPGDQLTYSMTMQFKSDGTDIEMTSTALDTVKELKEGVMKTERILRDVVLQTPGGEQHLGDVSKTVVVQKVTGEVTDIQRDRKREDQLRIALASQVVVPYKAVKIGDTWAIDRVASKKDGTVAMKLAYKAERTEQFRGELGVLISVDSKELSGRTPISATGSALVSVTTGAILRSVLTIQNVPLSDGPPVSAKLTLVAR